MYTVNQTCKTVLLQQRTLCKLYKEIYDSDLTAIYSYKQFSQACTHKNTYYSRTQQTKSCRTTTRESIYAEQ